MQNALAARHMLLKSDPAHSSRTAIASRTFMSGFGFKSKKDTFKYTGTQRPGVLSPRRTVPEIVVKPDYWSDSKPKAKAPILPWTIPVNTPEEIAGIRAGSSCQ
jgi:hypothetical protein